jgi:hypothetical protein
MIEPPREIDGAQVTRYSVVTDEVEPTGATQHFVGGVESGPAAALAIVRYPGEEAYYLLYLDARGEVVTDTWHKSLAAAMAQAAYEYEGLTWTDVAEA